MMTQWANHLNAILSRKIADSMGESPNPTEMRLGRRSAIDKKREANFVK
jgi:hypothetical protein